MRRNIELDLTKKQEQPAVPQVDSKKIVNEEESIEFSKNVIQLLKAKVKEHNSSNASKITVNDLKKVYLHGTNIILAEKTVGFSALARVNMYLRIIKAETLDSSFLGKTLKLNRSNLEIDFTDNWEPSAEDVKLTEQEALAKNLDKNFSLNELYFDEESPLTFGTTLRNLL
jgi:hypothetical protein